MHIRQGKANKWPAAETSLATSSVASPSITTMMFRVLLGCLSPRRGVSRSNLMMEASLAPMGLEFLTCTLFKIFFAFADFVTCLYLFASFRKQISMPSSSYCMIMFLRVSFISSQRIRLLLPLSSMTKVTSDFNWKETEFMNDMSLEKTLWGSLVPRDLASVTFESPFVPKVGLYLWACSGLVGPEQISWHVGKVLHLCKEEEKVECRCFGDLALRQNRPAYWLQESLVFVSRVEWNMRRGGDHDYSIYRDSMISWVLLQSLIAEFFLEQ